MEGKSRHNFMPTSVKYFHVTKFDEDDTLLYIVGYDFSIVCFCATSHPQAIIALIDISTGIISIWFVKSFRAHRIMPRPPPTLKNSL